MKKQKKNLTRIKPKYIKNAQGKTIQVYLDINSYESMMNRMKKFDAIKKQFVPNKATRKAIKEAEMKHNLIEVKNVKKL